MKKNFDFDSRGKFRATTLAVNYVAYKTLGLVDFSPIRNEVSSVRNEVSSVRNENYTIKTCEIQTVFVIFAPT